ncbi:Protein of unknown function [Kytococcus aerolatus]|uniref:DUF3071 domain-containing protein n=1 Tax=Kytococcus aerolatus TaxID=592308 RepID=A0A212T3H7_9MICO|nr:septation protein SepH [Kytococcus aerolatus]SNC60569.1 Protein of unknown function [Kytococcus aerolatus]
MADLHFTGVDDTGTHLLLAAQDGTEHRVEISEELRRALRQRPAPASTDQNSVELTPRDVQAMIRAGRSTEEVAQASGWPVEKISRYEAPILAEREHVAGLARGVHLPALGHGSSPTLEKRVKERLVMRGLRTDDAWWDAWRLASGPWSVGLVFTADGQQRRAVWHFDPQTHSVDPADDEARALSTAEGDEPAAAGRGGTSPEHEESAGSAEATGHEAVSHATHSSSDHTRALRAGDPLTGAIPVPDPAPEQEESSEHGSAAVEDASSDQPDEQELDGSPEAGLAPEIAPRQRQPKSRRGRPSVPSWDDIMFGGPKG